MNMSVSGIIGILLVVTLIAGLGGWVAYAYRNPHSASGQMLIRVRTRRSIVPFIITKSGIIVAASFFVLPSDAYYKRGKRFTIELDPHVPYLPFYLSVSSESMELAKRRGTLHRGNDPYVIALGRDMRTKSTKNRGIRNCRKLPTTCIPLTRATATKVHTQARRSLGR